MTRTSSNVLGAQLYTLREQCKTIPDIAASMARVRAIGYTAVQISGIGPVDPREVAKVMADNGLTVAITHTGWWNFVNETDKVIETHKLWNCEHSAIGSLGKEYYSPEGLDRFLAELAVVAPKLAAEGIDFSFHNHCIEFIKFDVPCVAGILPACAAGVSPASESSLPERQERQRQQQDADKMSATHEGRMPSPHAGETPATQETPNCLSPAWHPSCAEIHEFLRRMLMNPGPAISIFSARSVRSCAARDLSNATTFSARSRGFTFSFLAAAMTPLAL
jgi:hypothetical protein